MQRLRVVFAVLVHIILCAGEVRLGSSLMRQMWVTPIQMFSFLKDLSGGNAVSSVDPAVMETLKSEVTAYYSEFTSTSAFQDKDATKSDMFYRFQLQNELNHKICLKRSAVSKEPCTTPVPKAFEALAGLFHSAVVAYFKENYLDTSILGSLDDPSFKPSLAMSIWTSVHANGSYHASHHHKNSLLSGILYVATPSSAGAVVFEDPRGPLPPFGKTLHIVPQAGQLILFPSWLMHQVLPTLGSELRISVSFNYNGEWEATSDINQGFYV